MVHQSSGRSESNAISHDIFLWKNALCSEPYLLESDVIMKNNHGSRDKKATKQWQKEIQNASFNAS